MKMYIKAAESKKMTKKNQKNAPKIGLKISASQTSNQVRPQKRNYVWWMDDVEFLKTIFRLGIPSI